MGRMVPRASCTLLQPRLCTFAAVAYTRAMPRHTSQITRLLGIMAQLRAPGGGGR